MVNSDIWTGSGATVSMIPEKDIYLGPFVSIAAASDNQRAITLNATFTGNFSLLANLYRGCFLNIYTVSGNTLTDRALIQGNAATTITVNNSLSIATGDSAVGDSSAHYGVIEGFGAPVPAPKGTAAGTVYTQQALSVQFKSDTKGDYNDVGIIFGVLEADGGTERDAGIFFTSDGSFANAASLLAQTEYDITVDISNAQLTTAEEYIDAAISAINLVDTDEGDGDSLSDFTARRDGDKLILTNVYGGAVSRTPGTDDGGADSAIDSLDEANTSTIELSITTAGATTATGNPRLLSDTWLGLTTTVQIPNTTVTKTPMNLVAGGTRNYIYQYAGIERTSGGQITLDANSFWPLYYALGRITSIQSKNGDNLDTAASSSSVAHSNLTRFALTGGTNTGFIYSVDQLDGSNVLHRTDGTIICPPLPGTAVVTTTDGKFRQINKDDIDNDFFIYTFNEENGQTLPTFALEYSLKKADQASTVAVDSSKENVYTKIYPGSAVNTLSINADAVGGPITMNMSLNHKNTFVAPTNYETANNKTDVKNFVNFRGRTGQTRSLAEDADADYDALMQPFFFSDGTISIFGQDFLKIASFGLVINNNLTDQAYIGRFDKKSTNHITGQRDYQMNFTAHVTDSKVFDELQSQKTTALSTSADEVITLRFTKDNGEELVLKFKDYVVNTATFPVSNDRGPITVDFNIQPLTLVECKLTSYWAIQA